MSKEYLIHYTLWSLGILHEVTIARVVIYAEILNKKVIDSYTQDWHGPILISSVLYPLVCHINLF